jgi:hypothetical protein
MEIVAGHGVSVVLSSRGNDISTEFLHVLRKGGLADHDVDMPELDPAAVIEAVARDPWLRAFTGHGRIETLPTRQARRHLLLDKIAQAFEPGVRYSERRVSLFLGDLHADYAALRRYLVDEEFLSRSDGQYWRSGGTVLPSPPDEPRAQALPTGP